MIKVFSKVVLLMAFGIITGCASAQTAVTDSVKGSMLNMIESMIDSFGKVQMSKTVAGEICGTRDCNIKVINLPGVFHEIEIYGDVRVTLTNWPKDKIWVKGDLASLNNVEVSVKKRVLIVKAKKKIERNINIYLPAAELRSLITDGDSEIFSLGTVNTDALQIILNGTSMVSVKYNGKLDVFAGDRTEFIDIEEYRKIITRK